ncbi:MAG: hypothetical protein DME02_20170 [Candidatus Rokuibacteriota bacterium]|nr:MAG: hypothetical protein DME02_20170 [Candidatus Rokubacteria bacterium]
MPGDSRVMARILDTRAARSVISRIVSAVMTSNAMMVQAIFRMAQRGYWIRCKRSAAQVAIQVWIIRV